MTAIFDALRSIGVVAILLTIAALVTYLVVTWDAYSDIVDRAIERMLAPDDDDRRWRP